MNIIPGHLAMVQTSDDRPYAEGVRFLSRIIHETLALSFFYQRLAWQMNNGIHHGVDYDQARFCHLACFHTMVINIAKLIEKDSKTWNFRQLHREWSRYEHDVINQDEVLSAIKNLRENLAWIEEYRHHKAAHQTKDDRTSILTALPQDIQSLGNVVRMMDMFVDGKIPYTLHLTESGEEIDLREKLGV